MTNLMRLRQCYEIKQITSEEYEEQLIERTADILETEREFKFIDLLGRGSFGVVLSAISPDYENDIAVKFTRSEHSRKEEINIWPTLAHSNILPVHEINCLQHINIFVMPKLSKDLDTALTEDQIRKSPSGFYMVKKWLREALCGLDYLHSNKLCHMDVKADNILIDFDSTAKLSDFSFLQDADNPLKRYGAPLLYRPPALEKKTTADGTGFDIWCYGIMTLNAFTQHYMLKDIKEIDKKEFQWQKDIYPILFNCLQADTFKSLMSDAFPGSVFEENDFIEVLDFILFLLRKEAEDRPSAKKALDHVFLLKGKYRFENPDSIWPNNVAYESSNWSICIQSSNIKDSLRKRKLHRYKFHYKANTQKKNRKWNKTPKYQMSSLKFQHFGLDAVVPVDELDNSLKAENKDHETRNNEKNINIVMSKIENNNGIDLLDEINNHQKFLNEKNVSEKREIIVSRTDDLYRDEKVAKDIPVESIEIDVKQKYANSDDQLYFSKENVLRDKEYRNGNENDCQVPKKDNIRESLKKKRRFWKMYNWLQDTFRMLCVCGAASGSGK